MLQIHSLLLYRVRFCVPLYYVVYFPTPPSVIEIRIASVFFPFEVNSLLPLHSIHLLVICPMTVSSSRSNLRSVCPFESDHSIAATRASVHEAQGDVWNSIEKKRRKNTLLLSNRLTMSMNQYF